MRHLHQTCLIINAGNAFADIHITGGIMKILFVCSALLLLTEAGAQTRKQEESAGIEKSVSGTVTGSLTNTGAYQARRPLSNSIYDPTIRAMNNRTEYGGVPLFGKKSLLALPKGTYGFSNGQVWLRTTDATSIGGITGNGSVGTGSSNGGVGTSGAAIGVNGKNPYAGPAIWGSAQGLKVQDSVLRRKP
jgi:hypothetical protein